jgi:hypothetical protein
MEGTSLLGPALLTTLAERRRFGYRPVRHFGQRIAAHLPFRLFGKHDWYLLNTRNLPLAPKGERRVAPAKEAIDFPQRVSMSLPNAGKDP